MSKKVNITVMKLGRYSHLIVLNNHLVHGEFPNSATTILEHSIPMEKIADAFSVQDLEAMLAYRKGETKSIEELTKTELEPGPEPESSNISLRKVVCPSHPFFPH